jgi:hypothetical protein
MSVVERYIKVLWCVLELRRVFYVVKNSDFTLNSLLYLKIVIRSLKWSIKSKKTCAKMHRNEEYSECKQSTPDIQKL